MLMTCIFFIFSQIFSFFLTFYFDSFAPPNCFPLTIFHFLVCSLISYYFQRSSPLFNRFISMFSSPPLPPPLFHPKHISQPPLLYIPPPPSSFTSSLQPLLLSSHSHYSSSPAVRPDLSTPCPLPFISSKFLFFIVFQRSCLFFTPVCVRLCVRVWSQINTHSYWLLTFYPE